MVEIEVKAGAGDGQRIDREISRRGDPQRQDVPIDFRESLIVEFYAR